MYLPNDTHKVVQAEKELFVLSSDYSCINKKIAEVRLYACTLVSILVSFHVVYYLYCSLCSMCMPLLEWKYFHVIQYMQDVGGWLHCLLWNHKILIFYSVNASYDVGTYYSGSSNSTENANLYWLNNFDDLWSSYG